jgi:antitoxin MazE
VITKIQKWGNSQGVRFPKDVLRKAHVSIGDDVTIDIQDGEIVVKPIAVNRGKYKIRNLLSEMPENYSPEEVDWGKPIGGEVW